MKGDPLNKSIIVNYYEINNILYKDEPNKYSLLLTIYFQFKGIINR